MPVNVFANKASTTVAASKSAVAQGTPESWTVASSTTFPACSSSAAPPQVFYIVDNADTSEIVQVYNVSGTTWSVVRGAEGTTPVAHTGGFTVTHVAAASWMNAVEDRYGKRIFDVRAFGAVMDGVADDTAALQAALDAASAFSAANSDCGAKILIPPGEYKLSGMLLALGDNLVIEAYGAYIFQTASVDILRNYTSQDSSFTLNGRGLSIFGGVWDLQGHLKAQGTVTGNPGYSFLTISNSSAHVFRDIEVRNVKAYHAWDINTCKDIIVDSCRAVGFKNTHEWHTSVRVATTANSALASTFENGDTIDGVVLATNDRILIKNQSSAIENGIYFVNATGAPTRALDMNAAGEAKDAAVEVTSGTANAGTSWIQTAADPTPGTDPMTWASNWHLQCRVATTANGTMATAFDNASTVDGVVLATGDRILIKNQTTATENGIYVVQASGAPVRAGDADTAAELTAGAEVHVTAGTTNTGTDWVQTATVSNLATDPQTWGTDFIVNRYWSEAFQLDDGPNDMPCQNITFVNCYMGPAVDGSGLLSFGKAIGSHTDSTNGLYTNVRVMGCTSVDSLSNAIQGYSWADASIVNNTILGSAERGMLLKFNASNIGPRLTIVGNTVSQTVGYGIDFNGTSGSFGDVNISNNVITSSVMNATNNAGINIDTADRITVANNSIKLEGSSGAKHGINIDTVNGGVVSGNGIYHAGTQGIQTTATNRVGINNNYIYACGREGIWLTAVSSKNMISGNSIVGAGRTTNNTYGGITISGSANVDNSIVGNKFNKFGDAGNEALTPIIITNNSPIDTYIDGNTFGGDWGGPGLSNYTWNNNATVNLGDSQFTGKATGATPIGTTITAVAGLSIANVPAGTWSIYVYAPAVVVGSPTAFTITVSPSGGPTTTNIQMTATAQREAITAQKVVTGTAFNSAMAMGSLTAVATLFKIDGSFVSTNTGTISISMTRTGTTSVTIQTGAYLLISRQA